jgi:hypothetical protein
MREEGGREVDYLLEEKNLFSNGFWKKHKVTFSTNAYLLIFLYGDIYKRSLGLLARNTRIRFLFFEKKV